jgi:hypothetical protein
VGVRVCIVVLNPIINFVAGAHGNRLSTRACFLDGQPSQGKFTGIACNHPTAELPICLSCVLLAVARGSGFQGGRLFGEQHILALRLFLNLALTNHALEQLAGTFNLVGGFNPQCCSNAAPRSRLTVGKHSAHALCI